VPRLFVALDLPESLRAELTLLALGLAGARPTAPEQLHLTLRFVGEVAPATADDVRQALSAVRAASFPLAPRGVGCFPRRRDPRVAWVGFEPSDELEGLQRRIERVLVREGIPPDGRRFHPHVTVARMKGASTRPAAAWLEEHQGFRHSPFEVGDFHLYSSILRPHGAVHRRLATYPLESGPGASRSDEA
jgi:2'-5' RNA ligase